MPESNTPTALSALTMECCDCFRRHLTPELFLTCRREAKNLLPYGPRLHAEIYLDRRGGRLGYGMGYYDRTLAGLRAQARRPLAIGLAFAAQEVDEVPVGPQDVLLDGVITERALHRCPEPGASGA